MMGSNRSGRTLGIAAALALGLGATATAHADNLELRVATLAPPGSAWMKILDAGGIEVAKQTGDRVSIKYYAGGVQGDERDVVRKIRLGQLDGAAVTSVGLAMIDESIRVLELPMMFASIEEMDFVRDKMWGYFQKKFDKAGFRLGDKGDVGWVYFMSKTKVESLADLRSQKVWMWGDDTIVRAMFKKLNVSGVPLGVPEVDAALSSGRINACYGSPLAAVALQWSTKVKYMTSMPMSYAIGATIISNDAWAKIGADDQKAFEKTVKKIGKNLRKTVRKDNASALKQMTSKGVKLVQTPATMVADFETSAQEIWKDLVGKVYSQAELDMVLKYRDEYRAK
jgi:TRAP-type C4-dicarboxylate transport system substrate-binding protein